MVKFLNPDKVDELEERVELAEKRAEVAERRYERARANLLSIGNLARYAWERDKKEIRKVFEMICTTAMINLDNDAPHTDDDGKCIFSPQSLNLWFCEWCGEHRDKHG